MVKINNFIKTLIEADLLFMIAHGSITPIFAIFIVQAIDGGTATVAGTAVAILWLTKSVFRIPLAYVLDKKRGEKDDYYTMISGFIVYSLTYFLYIFATLPWHVYLIQFLMGIGAALAFTPWYGFFSRHLDKHHESFEWSIEVSIVGFAIAGAGFLAGVIVDSHGFNPIFIIGGVASLLGTILLLILKKELKIPKTKKRSQKK